MADELAGTWVFNDTIDAYGIINTDVDFVCDGKQGNNISLDDGWLNLSGIAAPAYTEGGWIKETYKTITITSKLSEVTNGDQLLAWLQANATKQADPSPAYPKINSFTYHGKQINHINGKPIRYVHDKRTTEKTYEMVYATFIDPTVSNGNITIVQAYSATQSGSNLIIG